MKRFMERFFAHPKLIVGIIAAITVFFAIQLPRAQVDNNNFRFIPEKDPSRLASAKIDATFGSQVFIMVGLERRFGTVFEADFLIKLRAFCKKVEDMPLVDTVTSLVTTDYVGSTADAITVEPLMSDDFTGSPAEISALKERLQEWDLYTRALVSDDGRAAELLIALNVTAKESGDFATMQAYKEIDKIADGIGFKDTVVHITGLPVFSSIINDSTAADLKVLIPLVAITVLVVLFLSFQRLGGIILPMLTVAVSAIWSIGLMVLFNVKLSIISTVLPVILVAVGSAYGIHVVSHYYDEIAARGRIDAGNFRQLIFSVLNKISRPVWLAALTTFAGFGSLCFTNIVPIFEFGVFASFGVIVAFAVALTLIPALFLIRGPVEPRILFRFKSKRSAAANIENPDNKEDALSTAIADSLMAITRKRRTTLFIGALVIALSLAGVSRLIIDNVMVEYFKSNTVIAKADAFIREYFGGSKTISVVVSHQKPSEVLRPDVLAAMDGLAVYLNQSVPEVGKVTGFTDFIKRMNQLFHSDDPPEAVRPPVGATADAGVGDFGFAAVGTVGDEPGFGFADAIPTSNDTAISGEPAWNESGATTLTNTNLAIMMSQALASSRDRIVSGDELVREVQKAVNYHGAAYYEIPTDPARYAKNSQEDLKAMIANYLVLLSGDISAFADDPLEPKSIRLNVQLRTLGQRDTERALKVINDYIATNFPKDVMVEVGGPALVEQALSENVVSSQLWSVATSLVMVFLIMAIYYRSVVAGLICLATLFIAILVNFGVMGAFGIKLNIGTAMVASIAVGTGIDYIIHYLAAYHHEYLHRKGGNFLRRTFLTCGKAIIFNAVSVGAGFAVLAFSQFNILAYLGVLMALAMATSSLVSLTILPVLIIMLDPKFIKRPMPFDSDPNTEA